MIHKIIGGKNRQKNINNSIKYLLRVNKSEKEKSFVSVLSQTNQQDLINFNKTIIDKNFKNPYVCGVLSFEEKNISDIEKNKLTSDFEELIFAGIPIEYRPPLMWVQHIDKGRLELNYLTFNALSTGRSFPVYVDSVDRRLFNDFVEVKNYENGYSSPFDDFSDVFQKRLLAPPGNTLPKNKKEFVSNLNNEIFSLIKEKKIKNRNELIDYFINIKKFKINRKSKNTISIVTDLDDTPIRLKGDVYIENRIYEDYFNEPKIRPERTQEEINNKLDKHQKSLAIGLEYRTARNNDVYIKPIKNRNNIINTHKISTIDTVGVTLIKNQGVTHGNQRKYRKSARSENLTTIADIAEQQQDIARKLQSINSSIERRYVIQDRIRDEIQELDGRFGFFGRYISGFVGAFTTSIRSIIYALGESKTLERTEEIEETKPESETKPPKSSGGSGSRGGYKIR